MRVAKYKVGDWVRYEGSNDHSKRQYRIESVLVGENYGPSYQLQYNGGATVKESDIMLWSDYEEIARRDQASADADKIKF